MGEKKAKAFIKALRENPDELRVYSEKPKPRPAVEKDGIESEEFHALTGHRYDKRTGGR